MIFAAIVAHRNQVLTSPPYVEQVLCLTEGDWLVKHDFDYARLRNEELHFEDGGPRCYWCSVLPAIMGLAESASPSPAAMFAGYRLTCWLATALMLIIAWRMTASAGHWWLGLLVVLTIYFTPLFSVQIEMLGMELPMVAAACLWWRAIDRNWHWTAVLLGCVPFAFKASAFVVPLAAATYYALLFVASLVSSRATRVSPWLALALANAAVFVVQMVLLVAGGNLHGRVRLFEGLDTWLRSSPDLLALLLLALLLAVCLVIADLRRGPRTTGTPRQRFAQALAESLRDRPAIWTGLLVVGLNVFAAATTYYESRHLALVVPFLVVLLALLALALDVSARTVGGGLALVLVFQILNQDGRFYPPLPASIGRGWGILERSLEYRRDHASNVAICRLLDKRFPDEPLLVGDQFLYFLKLPGLGYVRHARGDGSYDFIARDPNVLGVIADQPPALIVVRVPNQIYPFPFPAYSIAEPDPARGDEILYQDDLEPPIVVYRRKFQRGPSDAANMKQYVDLLFSDSPEVDPAAKLAIVGAIDLARRYVRADLPGLAADGADQEILRRLRALADSLQTTAPTNPFQRRLLETVNQRITALASRQDLSWLSWQQRTFLETWPQRLAYFAGNSGAPSRPEQTP